MIFTNYKILHDKPRKNTTAELEIDKQNILNPKMDFEDINPKVLKGQDIFQVHH